MKNDTELITDYIEGLLLDNDKESFEKRLEADEYFKNEYELHVNINEAISDNRISEFREQLKEIGESLETKNNKRVWQKLISKLMSFLGLRP